jgi:hypothetical protein
MKIENKKLIIEKKDLENLRSLNWKLLNLKNLQNIEYIEVKEKLFPLEKKSLFEISKILLKDINFYTRKT